MENPLRKIFGGEAKEGQEKRIEAIRRRVAEKKDVDPGEVEREETEVEPTPEERAIEEALASLTIEGEKLPTDNATNSEPLKEPVLQEPKAREVPNAPTMPELEGSYYNKEQEVAPFAKSPKNVEEKHLNDVAQRREPDEDPIATMESVLKMSEDLSTHAAGEGAIGKEEKTVEAVEAKILRESGEAFEREVSELLKRKLKDGFSDSEIGAIEEVIISAMKKKGRSFITGVRENYFGASSYLKKKLREVALPPEKAKSLLEQVQSLSQGVAFRYAKNVPNTQWHVPQDDVEDTQ